MENEMDSDVQDTNDISIDTDLNEGTYLEEDGNSRVVEVCDEVDNDCDEQVDEVHVCSLLGLL